MRFMHKSDDGVSCHILSACARVSRNVCSYARTLAVLTAHESSRKRDK
jgi:hypothetical protein